MSTLLLMALAVAGVTSLWLSGTLFLPVHKHLAGWRQRQGWRWLIQRMFARGALCPFCVSHWIAIAFGVGWYVAPEIAVRVATVAASVFLASHALVLFRVLEMWPQFISARIGAMHPRPVPDQGRAA
jgi:hypothetical protein